MKRPEILLVNPWIHDFAAYNLWAVPMGLLVLGTRLRLWGWEPRLLDCLDPSHPDMPQPKATARGKFRRTPIPTPEPLRHIPRNFCRYGLDPQVVKQRLKALPVPAAVLVTGMMTYWYIGVQETIRILREAFPGVPLLLGGVYATLMPDHARRLCGVDEVIQGPGEHKLREVLRRLTGADSSSGATDHGLEFTPALDLAGRVGFLPLLTSRGCPMRCSYCASGRLVSGFEQRPPALVIQEIESAVKVHNIRDVALYDDAFLVNGPKHALPILHAAANGSRVCVAFTKRAHASAIDPSVAAAMKNAGFTTIRIGLEASSDAFHARTGGRRPGRHFSMRSATSDTRGFLRNRSEHTCW